MTTSALSSTTGTLSSAGLGSGLDVKSIVAGLIAADSAPLTQLQKEATSVQSEISAMGQVLSQASALGDKAQALTSLSLWQQTIATSADTSAVVADTSDLSSGAATPGDYTVGVSQLACGQTVTAQAAAGSTLSAGTLEIQLGTYTSDGAVPPTTSFTAAASGPVSIAIGADDTSLTAIRDKINAAGAGISASIINDANGARLSLRSTATGMANGFRITATETADDGNAATGLSALNFDASTGATNTQMTLNQYAQNALASVNGIDIESATNKLSNVADGLSLTLLKASPSPVDVTVAYDSDSMKAAITGFVTAYSAVQTYIAQQTRYDLSKAPDAGTARTDGVLQGDSAVVGFQSQLRAIVTTTSTTSTMFARLSDLGIAVQKDGTLAVSNQTKLTSALNHPDELSKLFTTYGTTAADTGIARRFSDLCDKATALGGSLFSRNAGLQGELSRNQKDQANLQDHLDQEQERLTAQYQALDTTMSKSTALQNYVTQQISAMNKA